jgi:hypothetical protein
VLGLEPGLPPLSCCCGNGDSLPPPWLELGLPPPGVDGEDDGVDDGEDDGEGREPPGGCGSAGG